MQRRNVRKESSVTKKYDIHSDIPIPKRGTKGARASVAKRDWYAAMPLVHAHWLDWQQGVTSYDNDLCFAKAMLDSYYLDIKRESTVLRWIKDLWKKGLSGYEKE